MRESMVFVAVFAAIAVALPSPAVGRQSIEPGYDRPSWVPDLLKTAKASGVLVGYPMSHSRPSISRYEDAMALYAVIVNLSGMTAELKKSLDGIFPSRIGAEDWPSAAELPAFFSRTCRWVPLLLHALAIYADKYKAAEIDVPKTKAELESIARVSHQLLERVTPFADVPPGHWAAKAVGELRKLGILNGYPDSRFKG